MDELPAACVDADVAETGEEDEIAGPQRAAGDSAPVPVLGGGVVGKPDPHLAVHVLNEPGAVEAGPRRGAAPAIGDAREAVGDLNRTPAQAHSPPDMRLGGVLRCGLVRTLRFGGRPPSRAEADG